MVMNTLTRFVAANKYFLFLALAKASVAGAGLAIAALASIDLAIAAFAKEAWDAWQVDQLIDKFALAGAIGGAIFQVFKVIFFR